MLFGLCNRIEINYYPVSSYTGECKYRVLLRIFIDIGILYVLDSIPVFFLIKFPSQFLKITYPKSSYLLSGRRSFHNLSTVEHRRLRRLIAAPINGHEALTMYIKHTEDIVINSLDEWASMNEPFEFHKEIQRATFKIMTHIFMGSFSDSALWKTQNLYADYCNGLMSLVINLPGFAFHEAFKDSLKLEDEDITDLLLLFLTAGFDSSAISTLWAIIHLTEHPEALKKAKAIDEMLRMTSLFSIFREEKVDVSINGYIIPKGWKVLVWYGAVHMDSEIYENPRNFNPSRWNNLKARAEAFMRLGAGSKFCPGSDLAKLVITIFLHHFLLNYK
ncbi:beta-amyrin 11-oxidase-like [Fagus crenata]